MICTLQKLVSLSFYWLSPYVDGIQQVHFVHDATRHNYHREIRNLAVSFITQVDEFCKIHGSLSKLIDKPNIHRLLELVTHTIPILSHCHLISEMLFESAHQPLKFSLSRNSNKNGHIYAVDLVLSKDWFTRICHVWNSWKAASSDEDKELLMMSLLRLFLGEAFLSIDWKSSNELQSIKSEMQDIVIDAMSGAVSQQLTKWYSSCSDACELNGSWYGVASSKKEKKQLDCAGN